MTKRYLFQMEFYIALLGVLLAVGTADGADTFPPPCDSDIYCQGPLLHTVQMARIHNDSKHFVDMSMRLSPEEVKAAFQTMMARTAGQPSREDVRDFLDRNFQQPGSEFVAWNPSDWVDNPAFLARIRDPKLRAWIEDLHVTWKDLGREVAGEVYLHPDRYSLIFVPNPTIVPGGRFREYYYWDSYWVMKGLLLSEMHNTVKGMLQNFLAMVDRFGFVPNGGRIYYRRRSQPPFLTAMMKLYMDATDDREFLRSNIGFLEQEFKFWVQHRGVNVTKDGKQYKMYRYNAQVGQPRPESYREDYELVQQTLGGQHAGEEEQLYAELKSGAESGWDFSTRWFVPDAGQKGTLKDVKTRFIVPVDLNSLIYLNARLISEFYTLLGEDARAAQFQDYAERQKRNIEEVLWDEHSGSWFDWDTKNERLNKKFYPSNMFPVWVNASKPQQNAKFLRYIQDNVTNFTSGVPTSLEKSGQQWDFPNAWPPLQHVMIESLNNMATDQADQLAFNLTQRWIDTNYLCYMEARPHVMFEKYDVTQMGLPGGGGEYNVQVGFGWSNGVAMALAEQYGDRLRAPGSSAGRSVASLMLLLLTLLLPSLTA
ncbi:trehalase-like [Pollicipes pollicipes]|uniref:trehalase-like n=1 Tax=Pollicipes pollicipes TaxID=41117 RepID=UPI0018854106|nr:trehalase-like [Pollicipes pollicipes]